MWVLENLNRGEVSGIINNLEVITFSYEFAMNFHSMLEDKDHLLPELPLFTEQKFCNISITIWEFANLSKALTLRRPPVWTKSQCSYKYQSRVISNSSKTIYLWSALEHTLIFSKHLYRWYNGLQLHLQKSEWSQPSSSFPQVAQWGSTKL